MNDQNPDNLMPEIQRDEDWLRSVAGDGPEPDSLENLKYLLHAELEATKLQQYPTPEPSAQALDRCRAAVRQEVVSTDRPKRRLVPWAMTAAAAVVGLVIFHNLPSSVPGTKMAGPVASSESALDDLVELMSEEDWQDRWQYSMLQTEVDVLSEEYDSDAPITTIQDDSLDELDSQIDDVFDSISRKRDSVDNEYAA